jgi:hypothetical protein
MNADRVGALAAAGGPLLLLAGLLWHPFIPDLRDKVDVVRHMQADTAAWFGAHLVVALGAAILLLSFLAVRAHVRTSVGREPWTARAIPLLTVGSCLFVMLPAMEIAMLAVDAAGGDLVATHLALNTWFVPISMAGSAAFAIGSVLFAIGIHRARILPSGLAWVVIAALVVSAASRFAPMTLPLMIGAVALVVAMLPLAASMWNAGAAKRTRSVPA